MKILHQIIITITITILYIYISSVYILYTTISVYLYSIVFHTHAYIHIFIIRSRLFLINVIVRYPRIACSIDYIAQMILNNITYIEYPVNELQRYFVIPIVVYIYILLLLFIIIIRFRQCQGNCRISVLIETISPLLT